MAADIYHIPCVVSSMTPQFDAAIGSPTAPVLNTLGKALVQPYLYAIARLFDPSLWLFSRTPTQGPLHLTISEVRG